LRQVRSDVTTPCSVVRATTRVELTIGVESVRRFKRSIAPREDSAAGQDKGETQIRVVS
jgi:hypothetical protein